MNRIQLDLLINHRVEFGTMMTLLKLVIILEWSWLDRCAWGCCEITLNWIVQPANNELQKSFWELFLLLYEDLISFHSIIRPLWQLVVSIKHCPFGLFSWLSSRVPVSASTLKIDPAEDYQFDHHFSPPTSLSFPPFFPPLLWCYIPSTPDNSSEDLMPNHLKTQLLCLCELLWKPSSTVSPSPLAQSTHFHDLYYQTRFSG